MSNPSSNTTSSAPPELLEALRGLITQTRQQLLRRVDVAQVQTYCGIGRHIVEFEQGGKTVPLMASSYLIGLLSHSLVNLVRALMPQTSDICACFIRRFQIVTHSVTN